MEKELKSYNLMIENEFEVDSLPEKIRLKVDMMEELLEQYDDAENETEANQIALKIDSCDQGLYEDVQQYISQIKKEEESQEEEDVNDDNQIAKPQQINQQPQQPDRPHWRFWM